MSIPSFKSSSVDPRRAAQMIRLRHQADEVADVWGTDGRPRRRQLFHVQRRRKPRRCQAMRVSGLTMTTAVRPLRHTRDPDPEETLFGSGARVEAVTVPRLGAGVAQGEDIDLDGGTRADRQRV